LDQIVLNTNKACDLTLQLSYSQTGFELETVAFRGVDPATGFFSQVLFAKVGGIYTIPAANLTWSNAMLIVSSSFHFGPSGVQVQLDFDQPGCGRPPVLFPAGETNPVVRTITNDLLLMQVNL